MRAPRSRWEVPFAVAIEQRSYYWTAMSADKSSQWANSACVWSRRRCSSCVERGYQPLRELPSDGWPTR